MSVAALQAAAGRSFSYANVVLAWYLFLAACLFALGVLAWTQCSSTQDTHEWKPLYTIAAALLALCTLLLLILKFYNAHVSSSETAAQMNALIGELNPINDLALLASPPHEG